MVVALKEVKIRGEIRTTVDYCVEMIQSPDFVGNNIHTGWLDARISSHVSATLSPADIANPLWWWVADPGPGFTDDVCRHRLFSTIHAIFLDFPGQCISSDTMMPIPPANYSVYAGKKDFWCSIV